MLLYSNVNVLTFCIYSYFMTQLYELLYESKGASARAVKGVLFCLGNKRKSPFCKSSQQINETLAANADTPHPIESVMFLGISNFCPTLYPVPKLFFLGGCSSNVSRCY